MKDSNLKSLNHLKTDQNMKDLFALPFEKRHEENLMDIGTQMNEFPEMFGQQVSSKIVLDSDWIDLTLDQIDWLEIDWL